MPAFVARYLSTLSSGAPASSLTQVSVHRDAGLVYVTLTAPGVTLALTPAEARTLAGALGAADGDPPIAPEE